MSDETKEIEGLESQRVESDHLEAEKGAFASATKSQENVVNYAHILIRFHQLMAIVTLLGGGLVYSQFGQDHLLPFGLGSGLVWINMTVLARGLGGVLNGEKSLVFVLLLKLGFLVGGVLLLSQFFPDQRTSLILGCSTWVLALMMMGQPKPKGNIGALGLWLCLSLSANSVEAKPTEAELLEGEVYVQTLNLPNSSMPKIVAEGIIKAPIDALWSVIADCANFKETMANIKASKHLGFFNGFKRCELVVDLPFPLSDLRSVVDVKLKKGEKIYTRTWHLVEGDYHKNQGEWRLSVRPDGYTTLKYTVHVEPKIAIPDFVARAAQKRKIPGMFEDLRELMEKRGKLLP